LQNVQFCSSSRKAKILTTGIYWIFRGLKFEPDAEIGQKGTLCKGLRVLITTEGQLHDEFKKYRFPLPPEKLHDVLAFASMYIGVSQIVTVEASVLGVPCMCCNTFVGRITYIEEL